MANAVVPSDSRRILIIATCLFDCFLSVPNLSSTANLFARKLKTILPSDLETDKKWRKIMQTLMRSSSIVTLSFIPLPRSGCYKDLSYFFRLSMPQFINCTLCIPKLLFHYHHAVTVDCVTLPGGIFYRLVESWCICLAKTNWIRQNDWKWHQFLNAVFPVSFMLVKFKFYPRWFYLPLLCFQCTPFCYGLSSCWNNNDGHNFSIVETSRWNWNLPFFPTNSVVKLIFRLRTTCMNRWM